MFLASGTQPAHATLFTADPVVTASATSTPAHPRIDLMGARLDVLTEAQTIQFILDALRLGRGGWVITPNLDQLRLFRKLAEVRQFYAAADLVLADGMPLVWAARLQKTPLPQRVAGSSLVFTLTQAAVAEGRSVYLLGGNSGTAQRAAQVFRTRYPAVKIAGAFCPPLGFEEIPGQIDQIVKHLTAAKPDIVYVGLGFPKQERLINRLRPLLPGTWFLGIGISLSIVCGEVRRAPRWMQRIGMEWLYRLVQEPLRLFRRYILCDIPFALRLLAASLRNRFASRRA